MMNISLIETRFEQYIKHFNRNKKMYQDAVAGGVPPDSLEEIFKDCRFTFSELEASADEGSSQEDFNQAEKSSKKGNEKQALTKLKKDFGATPSEPRKKVTEFLEENKASRKRS